MKPETIWWKTGLVFCFIVGYCVNPALSMFEVDVPKWLTLVFVFFGAFHVMMIFMMIPENENNNEDRKDKENG